MLEDGTYDKDGLRIAYPDGYQVGIWDRPTNADGQTFQWIIENMTRTTENFGAWVDQETGKLWVEPCVWIQDLDSALRIARALNQIAIWDWSEMKEIRLSDRVI
jgi:predicted fused transcriptional regulator/phosphomethylpyrimidine kinase